MPQLFSNRYKGLFDSEENWLGDDTDEDVPYDVRVRLARVMEGFREPIAVRPNRYDDYTIGTDALSLAIGELNNEYDAPIVNLDMMVMGSGLDETHALANACTPYLFDLIELQYGALSDDPENGKEGFRKEVNAVFREYDVPWLLADGCLVKIDAKQFEQDLKLKTLETMRELKDAEPRYQGAYDELMRAVEFLRRGEYAEAVINAEKSYESVLKVICGQGSETSAANELTKRIIRDGKLSLPQDLKGEAFQSKVLMSLPLIRNKSAAHGVGTAECGLDEPLTNFAVNLACALNTYLVQEATSKE